MLAIICVPSPSPGASTQTSPGAFIYLPIIGLTLGAIFALLDHFLSTLLGPVPRSILVLACATAIERGILLRGIAKTAASLWRGSASNENALSYSRWLCAAILFGFETVALSSITKPAMRSCAIVLALMLSRWSIVPLAYGLRAVGESGLGLRYDGGITFREFAISSICALGIAMTLYQALALAAIVMVAVIILIARLAFSRRLGGVDGYAVASGAAICEFAVFATVATLLAAVQR
jgi:cobalamin synthase